MACERTYEPTLVYIWNREKSTSISRITRTVYLYASLRFFDVKIKVLTIVKSFCKLQAYKTEPHLDQDLDEHRQATSVSHYLVMLIRTTSNYITVSLGLQSYENSYFR